MYLVWCFFSIFFCCSFVMVVIPKHVKNETKCRIGMDRPRPKAYGLKMKISNGSQITPKPYQAYAPYCCERLVHPWWWICDTNIDHGFETGMIRNDENVLSFFVSMFISRLFLHMFKDFLSEVCDLLFSGETTILVSPDLTLDLFENSWSKTCFSH